MSVYNAAEALDATIDSVLSQQGVSLELIVIDDGSTDGSGRIADDHAARDGRIRVLHQENRGLTAALRRGCSEARGTYIARQDAGDRSEPRRLRDQKTILDQDRGVVFVSCWTRYVGPRGEELWTDRGRDLPDRPIDLIDPRKEWGVVGGPTHHGSVMMRRDAYDRAGGYRTEFYYGQDWDLWYRLAAIGKFRLIPRVLYTARIDPDSISSSSRKPQAKLARLSHAALVARSRGESDAPVVERAARIRPTRRRSRCGRSRGLYFIGEALRRNRDARARAYFLSAIRTCPLNVKAWLRLTQTWLA